MFVVMHAIPTKNNLRNYLLGWKLRGDIFVVGEIDVEDFGGIGGYFGGGFVGRLDISFI